MIIKAPKPGESLDTEPPLVGAEQDGDQGVLTELLADVRQCLTDYRLLLADYGDGNPYAQRSFLPSCGYQVRESSMTRRYAWFSDFSKSILLSHSRVSDLHHYMKNEVIARLKQVLQQSNRLGTFNLRERVADMLRGTFLDEESDAVLNAVFNLQAIKIDRQTTLEVAPT